MTTVKICGLTREQDVTAAVALGADMLGFIQVPRSPRFVPESRLADLLATVPERIKRVLVVQDADPDHLDHLRANFSFDYFQFHGDEPQHFIVRWPGYRVFHIDAENPGNAPRVFGSPYLVDTAVRGERGGTGLSFDWSILTRLHGEFIVAGGLNADNVGRLVQQYRPWGVDVSSGIEREKGVKDHQHMRRFIENVRRASS
jgi:phosphoribosylanthranilate isomerase